MLFGNMNFDKILDYAFINPPVHMIILHMFCLHKTLESPPSEQIGM